MRARVGLGLNVKRWQYAAATLGWPDVRGRWTLVAAILIDSLGTGLFLPFALIYPTVVAHIPLGVTGAMLSLATLVALPIPLLIGVVVDNLGVRFPIIAANLLQAAGFAGYLMLMHPWYLFVCALCVAVGNQAYWAANGAFLAAVAQPAQRARWFALQGACRTAGIGIGTAIASVAATALSGGGYRLLAVLNAASFVAAAVLSARVSVSSIAHTSEAVPAHRRQWLGYSHYAPILRDRPFLGFTATNVAFSLCVLSFSLAFPVFVLGSLHLRPWIVGALFTMNTALVATTQTVVAKWLVTYRRTRALACAAGLFGAGFVTLALVSCLVGPRGNAGGLVMVGLIASTGTYTLAELVMAPLKNALVADAAPEESRGRYVAFYHLSWSMASAAAPALLTALLARGPLMLWSALTAVAVLAALALARLDVLLPERAIRGTPS